MKTLQLFFILSFFLCSTALKAQDRYLGDFNVTESMGQNNVHGISIAVYKNLELDTLIQFGTRDENDQQPVDGETLFQAGSMTCAITNFALMQASLSGKIDFDKAANDYLTAWKIPETGRLKSGAVTVRDLILQTRGFDGASKPEGYVPGSSIPTLLQVLNGEAPANSKAIHLKKDKNKSGNTAYTNTVILQLILEEVYQMPFGKIIQQEVFDPLEMTNSYMIAALSDALKQNASVGFTQKGNAIKGLRWIYPELSCTGLWTTPNDYAKFTAYIIKAAQGIDNRILTKEAALAGLNPEGDAYRALLLLKNGKRIYWGGASMGFRTQMTAKEEGGLVYVIFMNSFENWQYMADFSGKVKDWINTN